MPDDQGAIRKSLRALSQFFVKDGTLGDTLLRVSEMACGVTPAKYAGITLLVEGKPRTGVFTSTEAPEIDEAQYETGEGPCLDAFRHQRIFRVESTTQETRWPAFCALAAAHGIGSTMSVPLSVHGESLGALNLYAEAPRAFGDQDEETVQIFADQAAIALANAQVYWDARQLSENLTQAIKSRETIDHAVGILMANGGLTPQDAFQMLVRASQRENRKLRDVAEEIVTRTIARQTEG
jgi:GAF domain-containing protein